MPITSRAAGIAIATAAAAAIAPSPALAKNAVYGGSTSKGAAIVIKADKKAKTLRVRGGVVDGRSATTARASRSACR